MVNIFGSLCSSSTRMEFTTCLQMTMVIQNCSISWFDFVTLDLNSGIPIVELPSLRDYYVDCEYISSVIVDGPTKTLAFRRLRYLEAQFSLFQLLNEAKESEEQKGVPHRDFYNVRKVDTHVHHSACMNCKHLLRFIKSKLKRNPEVRLYTSFLVTLILGCRHFPRW